MHLPIYSNRIVTCDIVKRHHDVTLFSLFRGQHHKFSLHCTLTLTNTDDLICEGIDEQCPVLYTSQPAINNVHDLLAASRLLSYNNHCDRESLYEF